MHFKEPACEVVE